MTKFEAAALDRLRAAMGRPLGELPTLAEVEAFVTEDPQRVVSVQAFASDVYEHLLAAEVTEEKS